jgi:hypothetical protein
MLGTDFMPTQVKQIGHSGMGTQKPLRLPHRFEFPHPPFPHPGRLMQLFSPIVGILRIIMDNVRPVDLQYTGDSD